MKANELMIGDWVHFIDLDDCIEKDIQWTAEDYIEIDEDFCNPILLTEDILKANGFEYDKNGCLEKKIPHKEQIDDTITVGGSESVWHETLDYYEVQMYVYPHNIEVHIAYVHELQHVLHICGLNVLADNFKITHN